MAQLVSNIPVQAPAQETPQATVPAMQQPAMPTDVPYAPIQQTAQTQQSAQAAQPQAQSTAHHMVPKVRTQWLVIALAVVVAVALAAAAYYSLNRG